MKEDVERWDDPNNIVVATNDTMTSILKVTCTINSPDPFVALIWKF